MSFRPTPPSELYLFPDPPQFKKAQSNSPSFPNTHPQTLYPDPGYSDWVKKLVEELVDLLMESLDRGLFKS